MIWAIRGNDHCFERELGLALGNIGKYERLDVLGHGTSGIVYLAWDTLLRKHVALKEINVQADEESRFLEEARVLDRLRHPNIVQVNGVDRIDGRMLIDMEYVKGTNLNEYLREKKKLSAREALNIAIQICAALDFAHQNHTVHRDIKPANVLISEDGVAKLVDFGLAEIIGSGSYAGGAGTYAYMSPEDFDEVRHSDYRSDIWAIGVTLYEMIAGKRPFQSPKPKDPFAWKRIVSEDEPVPLTDIDPLLPKDLDSIVRKALAKDMQDRYQSAGDMYNDMMKVLTALGGPPRTTLPPLTVETLIASLEGEKPEIAINPERISFGSLRKGDFRRQHLDIRVEGRGRMEGRVLSQPGWISVEPQSFDRRRQRLSITANMENIWRPGVYNEQLDLELDGQTVTVPVHAVVLPKRRSFKETAWWYIPLFFSAFLPLIAFGSHSRTIPGRQSVSLISVGMLLAMLFVTALAADLSAVQKIIPLLFCGMCLGTAFGTISGGATSGASGLSLPNIEGMVCAIFSMIVAFQLTTYSKWRVWGVIQILIAFGVTAFLTR